MELDENTDFSQAANEVQTLLRMAKTILGNLYISNPSIEDIMAVYDRIAERALSDQGAVRLIEFGSQRIFKLDIHSNKKNSTFSKQALYAPAVGLQHYSEEKAHHWTLDPSALNLADGCVPNRLVLEINEEYNIRTLCVWYAAEDGERTDYLFCPEDFTFEAVDQFPAV